jgi:hypothetical protein
MTMPDPFDDTGLSQDYMIDPSTIQERTSSDPLTKLYHQAREQGLSKKEARSVSFALARGVQPRQQQQQQENPGW